MNWLNIRDIESKSFRCGYCGYSVASGKGYLLHPTAHPLLSDWKIIPCPHCGKASFFTINSQTPDVIPGVEVLHLPDDIEALYKEARLCVSASCYTSSVLACRKLLMNIAVQKGAKEGESFTFYINYLEGLNYFPPGGRSWVDHIRKKGNEATHEIALKSRSDAEELISLTEMLLKFIFEFPNRIPASP